ncbi:MAG: 3-deoxy-8-phosphooctulonate synthase [Amylibacter sp.]|nr:3-deoxy-8-phosphooctulonate synthase [Amylibacter sp.]
MQKFDIGKVTVGNDQPLMVIAGPCALESSEHALMIAREIQSICADLGAGFIFKGSFDKANRTSLDGKRGLGIEAGLQVMSDVKDTLGCPVITDVHAPDQCVRVAKVVDVLQIPAFLCRQTDLLLAAGETGAAVNVKKGQFLSPWEMPNVLEKVASTGNKRVMACERGTSFGYNTLIADMRSLPQMMATGHPVVMDATHSVQQPGGKGGSSGGQREFAPLMARCAISTGIAGLFMETHEDPDNAPSDGPNMVPLNKMRDVIKSLMAFDRLAKADPFRI